MALVLQGCREGVRDGSSTSQGGVAVAVGRGETVPEGGVRRPERAHPGLCRLAYTIAARNCDLELQVQTSKRQRPAAVCKEGECTGRGGVWLPIHPKWSKQLRLGQFHCERIRRTKGARSGNRVGGQLLDDFFKSKKFKQAMVAAVFVLAGIIGCIVWRWDWLNGGEQGNTPSETLRNMGLLIAGVLALAFALWRARVAGEQSATARRQANTAQLDLLNDRYQRGAQLLGNDDLSVRMAGIYSLQRLAEDSDQYDLQVMQVFCAFVRNHTEDDESVSRRSERIIRLDKVISEDVQTALAAVRKRCQLEQSQFKLPKFTVDLSGAILNGCDLSKMDLSGANLYGAQLNNCDLSESSLSGADVGRANFHNAYLNKSILSGATFWRTDLSDISGDMIDISHTNIQHSSFSSASWTRPIFRRSQVMRTDFSKTSLKDADISGTVFMDFDVSNFDPFVKGSTPSLTQAQVDEAKCDSADPPTFYETVLDAETGERIVWRPLLCRESN